jgi:hypothetical protein
MDDPGVRAQRNDPRRRTIRAPREDIDVESGLAKARGEVPNVEVHAAGVRPAKRRDG